MFSPPFMEPFVAAPYKLPRSKCSPPTQVNFFSYYVFVYCCVFSPKRRV